MTDFLFTILFLTLTSYFGNVIPVEWWDNHPEQRKEFLKKCRNGDFEKYPRSCMNARESLGPSGTFFDGLNRHLFGEQD